MVKVILSEALRRPRLDDFVRQELRSLWDEKIQEGVDTIKSNAAVFEGGLRDGYRLEPSLFRDNEIFAAIVNDTPDSLFRERGRAPGKPPPARRGTPLDRWARSKGLNPFAVAIRIGRRGTSRWRLNKNAAGIDRFATPENLILKDYSPVFEVERQLLAALKDLKI